MALLMKPGNLETCYRLFIAMETGTRQVTDTRRRAVKGVYLTLIMSGLLSWQKHQRSYKMSCGIRNPTVSLGLLTSLVHQMEQITKEDDLTLDCDVTEKRGDCTVYYVTV